ncbi:MAG: Ig-like domain-containing protein [Bacteroidales bacterium]|nr:Ig-like domain-containing protein [Bacteroidales bacterium]
MQTRFFLLSLILLLSPVLMFRCANPVTPQGGDKDITPPKAVACIPPNYSTHFSSPDIRITFNEFIALKSPSSEIFISPPLDKKPDYKLRGKTIIVDFDQALDSNTTYIINFGKSINDITEGNILLNFQYVFSTGNFIDSLSITGKVIYAFDNQPVSEAFAELYLDNNDTIPFDSLPYLVPPLYITETDKQGMFTFSNLHPGDYKLIVLEDNSGDFIYNMPAEKIAFEDSLISPWFIQEVLADSTGLDSINPPPLPIKNDLLLKLFEEIDSTQEVIKSELVTNDMFRIIYKFPPHSPVVIPLNLDSTHAWCMEEFSPNRDTLLFFPTIEIPDTLILEVHDGEMVLDTVLIAPTHIAKAKHPKKKEEEEKPERLLVNWNSRSTFNYFKNPLIGRVSHPLSEYDLSGILLISNGDTMVPTIEFTDPLVRFFKVSSSWKEGTSYKLVIPDSAFLSFNGLYNEMTVYTVKTVVLRELGSLLLNINTSEKPGDYIIQLLTDKGIVVEEKYLNESGQVKFAFIAPATYTIKAILDYNRNKRWDTGDYLKKIQPETVFFFPKPLDIRGNWDVEEEWKL